MTKGLTKKQIRKIHANKSGEPFKVHVDCKNQPVSDRRHDFTELEIGNAESIRCIKCGKSAGAKGAGHLAFGEQ